jgi:hypothetical protein
MADDKNKKEEVKAQGSTAEQVREIVEAMVPSIVAAVQAGNQRSGVAPKAKKPKCHECGQDNMACGEKHRQVVVFVSGPYERWFQGVQINGVAYKSNNASHLITVPADANVEYMMEQFRASEERFATGRNFQHNSGYIAQNGPSNFKPATGPAY